MSNPTDGEQKYPKARTITVRYHTDSGGFYKNGNKARTRPSTRQKVPFRGGRDPNLNSLVPSSAWECTVLRGSALRGSECRGEASRIVRSQAESMGTRTGPLGSVVFFAPACYKRLPAV